MSVAGSFLDWFGVEAASADGSDVLTFSYLVDQASTNTHSLDIQDIVWSTYLGPPSPPPSPPPVPPPPSPPPPAAPPRCTLDGDAAHSEAKESDDALLTGKAPWVPDWKTDNWMANVFNVPGGSWLGLNNDCQSTVEASQDFTLGFTLTAEEAACASLSLQFGADNGITSITLNAEAFAPPAWAGGSKWKSWSSVLVVDRGFVEGENTLTVTVWNEPKASCPEAYGAGGFYMKGLSNLCCPSPLRHPQHAQPCLARGSSRRRHEAIWRRRPVRRSLLSLLRCHVQRSRRQRRR